MLYKSHLCKFLSRKFICILIALVELNQKLGVTFCSQPPLLSSMVHEIYSRTGDKQLVKKSLPALLKEYQFWSSGTMRYILLRYSLDCLCFVAGIGIMFEFLS
jgi:hypothetical protein